MKHTPRSQCGRMLAPLIVALSSKLVMCPLKVRRASRPGLAVDMKVVVDSYSTTPLCCKRPSVA